MLSSLDSTVYRTNSDKTCVQTFLNVEQKGTGGEGRGGDAGRRFNIEKLEVFPNWAQLPLASEPFGLCNK